jgi:beta-exotoxin I transport system permease protein
MNIFKYELKANFRSLLIWAVIVVLFVLLGVSKFSAYYHNQEMAKLISDLPQALQDILNTQAFDLTKLTGFFGVMFTYFALLLSIAAGMWGADIISREERDKTVEFSLSMPVTRARLITYKALAALVNCIVLLGVTWGASLVSASKYQPDAAFFKFLALEMLAVFFLQLIFLAVGLLLGCAMKRYRMAVSTAVFVLLGTYFLSVFVILDSRLDFLRFFTPFAYFNPATLLNQSSFDAVFIILTAVIVIASMAGAYVSYAKRDLYI